MSLPFGLKKAAAAAQAATTRWHRLQFTTDRQQRKIILAAHPHKIISFCL
jgi:hypothetical protein